VSGIPAAESQPGAHEHADTHSGTDEHADANADTDEHSGTAHGNP
jgi:hypothetical protein